MPTGAPDVDGCDTGAGHDLLHQCAAVLHKAVGLHLAWIPVIVLAAAGGQAGHRSLITRLRDPPRLSGKDLLTSVCVSRT